MLKLFHIGGLGCLLVALMACQSPKQVDGTTDVAASTPPTASPEVNASAMASGSGAIPQASDTAWHSADDAAAYDAARTAFEAGASLEALGQYGAASDEFQQAVELFEKVVQNNPGHFKAMVNWGSALSRVGRPVEGVAKFQQALALVPDHVNRAEVLYNWGTALERLGRHREAIEKFDQAIALKADLLSPALQGYLHRHRPRSPDSEVTAPGSS